jgi:hypothetical protein
MLFVNEPSWHKVFLATDFMNMFFEEDHIVKVVLDKILLLMLIYIVVFIDKTFKCNLVNLLSIVLSKQNIIARSLALSSYMLQIKFRLRNELFS